MNKQLVLAFVALSTPPAVLADTLDIIATEIHILNSRTGLQGSTITAEEGDVIQILCHERIVLAGNNDFWETKNVVRWQNRFLVDEQAVAVFNPTLPGGTKIGNYTKSSGGILGIGSSSESVKGNPQSIGNSYGPFPWIAQGVGPHQVTCQVNTPKQMSDNTPANNTIHALVNVSAKAPPPPPPAAPLPAGSQAGGVSAVSPGISSIRGADNVGRAALQQNEVSGAGDTPAMPPAATVAQGIKVLRPDGGIAPPNPCSLEVSFYVPEAPVVRTSGGTQSGEQVEIACGFRKQTRTLSWPQCDDAARKAMARIQSAQSSAARYSGIVQIDGNTVGVGSSPADGSDFTRTQLYAFKEPGAHEIRCQTDNALRFAIKEAPTYLDSGVSLSVAARDAGGRQLQRFEAAAAKLAEVKAIASQPLPTFADSGIALLEQATARVAAGEVPAGAAKPGAPPNPCSADVVYYKPGAPMAEAASASPIVGEVIRLRCEFYRTTARVEFPSCDANAERALERLRSAQQRRGGSTGALHVDGKAVRSTGSPLDGGDFWVEADWTYQAAGQHEVGCAVDNGLRAADSAAVRELARSGLHSIAQGRLKRPGGAEASGQQRLTLTPGPSALTPLSAGSGARLIDISR